MAHKSEIYRVTYIDNRKCKEGQYVDKYFYGSSVNAAEALVKRYVRVYGFTLVRLKTPKYSIIYDND